MRMLFNVAAMGLLWCCLLNLGGGGGGGGVWAKVPLSNLMQFLEHSRDLSQHNPQRSLVCFDCYLPLLHVIAQDYEASYAACLETATAAKLKVDNASEPERTRVELSTHSLCEIFTECKNIQDSVEYFECYANAGTANMKSMYVVSSNATDVLTKIREQYRTIENEEFRCTNASERAYVKSTAETYDQLQRCLQESMQEPSVEVEGSTTVASVTPATKITVSSSTSTQTSSSTQNGGGGTDAASKS